MGSDLYSFCQWLQSELNRLAEYGVGRPRHAEPEPWEVRHCQLLAVKEELEDRDLWLLPQ